MSFELESQTGQHVKKMAPKKTTKKGAPKRTLLKKKTAVRRSKRIADQQLEKRLKKYEEIMEEQIGEWVEQLNLAEELYGELEEKMEEHIEDGSAHQFKEQLEELRTNLAEHVGDGSAHQRLDQLEELLEPLEELDHRLGGLLAAVHALWRLEEGSKSQGGHFVQGGVAFQVALSIIIISSPAFESSSSSSPLTYQVSMCRRFPER